MAQCYGKILVSGTSRIGVCRNLEMCGQTCILGYIYRLQFGSRQGFSYWFRGEILNMDALNMAAGFIGYLTIHTTIGICAFCFVRRVK